MTDSRVNLFFFKKERDISDYSDSVFLFVSLQGGRVLPREWEAWDWARKKFPNKASQQRNLVKTFLCISVDKRQNVGRSFLNYLVSSRDLDGAHVGKRAEISLCKLSSSLPPGSQLSYSLDFQQAYPNSFETAMLLGVSSAYVIASWIPSRAGRGGTRHSRKATQITAATSSAGHQTNPMELFCANAAALWDSFWGISPYYTKGSSLPLIFKSLICCLFYSALFHSFCSESDPNLSHHTGVESRKKDSWRKSMSELPLPLF